MLGVILEGENGDSLGIRCENGDSWQLHSVHWTMASVFLLCCVWFIILGLCFGFLSLSSLIMHAACYPWCFGCGVLPLSFRLRRATIGGVLPLAHEW